MLRNSINEEAIGSTHKGRVDLIEEARIECIGVKEVVHSAIAEFLTDEQLHEFLFSTKTLKTSPLAHSKDSEYFKGKLRRLEVLNGHFL